MCTKKNTYSSPKCCFECCQPVANKSAAKTDNATPRLPHQDPKPGPRIDGFRSTPYNSSVHRHSLTFSSCFPFAVLGIRNGVSWCVELHENEWKTRMNCGKKEGEMDALSIEPLASSPKFSYFACRIVMAGSSRAPLHLQVITHGA